jgi:hypothetical protein
VPLTGFPKRLRVSAGGRMIAWTLFIDGHSYTTTGFSTKAGVLDTRTGKVVNSLEGDFAARTLRKVRDNVECPSLSPGGTRTAYKSAVDADPAKGRCPWTAAAPHACWSRASTPRPCFPPDQRFLAAPPKR